MKLLQFKKYYILIFILVLCDCACGGFIGIWREFFWESVSKKEVLEFFILIGEFSIAALISCFVTGYQSYLISILSLAYRTKLTRKALQLKLSDTEGYAQRIQEDCLSYPSLMLTLSTGVVKSLSMIIVYTVILVNQLPLFYLLFPLVYTILGTGIAAYIAKPLISLNYINQVVEAKFRQSLTKLNYKNTHRNNYNLFRTTKFLAYFQSFYNQITIIVPYLGLSFIYFSGKITFGVFMQVSSSMIEIINNLSFLINSFNDLNKLLSCRKRLLEVKII